MTICYIRWLIEEYPNEYKGDEYNLIHSSIPTNINYIFASSRGNTSQPCGFYILRLTDEYTGRVTFIYVGYPRKVGHVGRNRGAAWLIGSSVNRLI
jgi:hypothetical protein